MFNAHLIETINSISFKFVNFITPSHICISDISNFECTANTQILNVIEVSVD